MNAMPSRVTLPLRAVSVSAAASSWPAIARLPTVPPSSF